MRLRQMELRLSEVWKRSVNAVLVKYKQKPMVSRPDLKSREVGPGCYICNVRLTEKGQYL